MSMSFERYSSYYDSFYTDKDYEAETAFLEQILQQYSTRRAQSILDLGCGTGGHALPLAQRGYLVTGVDRSVGMLKIAAEKTRLAGVEVAFSQNDIRSVDLGKTFDSVISMFAVMSYQIENDDLSAALQSARRHLGSGGVFVFDAWSGPAVLTERPVDRLKVIETNGVRLLRYATPKLDIMNHRVEVHYKVLHIKGACVLDEVDETHSMRFLFPQELRYFLTQNGFRVRHICPFMKMDHPLTDRDWNLTVVAEAV